MKIAKHLLEGIKLLALFSAIALVVWSMPDRGIESDDKTANPPSLSSR